MSATNYVNITFLALESYTSARLTRLIDLGSSATLSHGVFTIASFVEDDVSPRLTRDGQAGSLHKSRGEVYTGIHFCTCMSMRKTPRKPDGVPTLVAAS